MNKKYVPIALVALVIVLAVGFMIISSGKSGKKQDTKQNNLPNSQVIPTVDSSVKVTLEPKDASKHEITLGIKGVPQGTDTIEYELSYNTKAQGLQGIAGEPVEVKGKQDFSKTFLLGTESSGAKTYHVVEGAITVSLKFNGSYGVKAFDKDFDL